MAFPRVWNGGWNAAVRCCPRASGPACTTSRGALRPTRTRSCGATAVDVQLRPCRSRARRRAPAGSSATPAGAILALSQPSSCDLLTLHAVLAGLQAMPPLTNLAGNPFRTAGRRRDDTYEHKVIRSQTAAAFGSSSSSSSRPHRALFSGAARAAMQQHSLGYPPAVPSALLAVICACRGRRERS